MFTSFQAKNNNSSGTIVDIAPLIDIVFILVIFLVTSTFVKDTGVSVTRHQVTVTQNLESKSMRVSVTAAGDIYTKGRRVSLVELRSKIAALISAKNTSSVIVIPDAEVVASPLFEVMDAAKQGGATDVALATLPKGR